MTTTTPTTTTKTIVRDWHELCWNAAVKLDRNMRDGYTEGFESTLADEVVAELTGDDEAAALARMLLLERITGLMLSLSLLDDADDSTYRITERAASAIMDEIAQQDGVDYAVAALVTDEIVELQRTIREPLAT